MPDITPIRYQIYKRGSIRRPLAEVPLGKNSRSISQVKFQQIIGACLRAMACDVCDDATNHDPALIAAPHNAGECPDGSPDTGWIAGELTYPNTFPELPI